MAQLSRATIALRKHSLLLFLNIYHYLRGRYVYMFVCKRTGSLEIAYINSVDVMDSEYLKE